METTSHLEFYISLLLIMGQERTNDKALNFDLIRAEIFLKKEIINHLSVYMPTHPPACLHVYLTVYLPACLHVYLSVRLSVYLPACLPVCLYV